MAHDNKGPSQNHTQAWLVSNPVPIGLRLHQELEVKGGFLEEGVCVFRAQCSSL